ncbi:MAG TPA: hypothetical protein VE523_09460 [Solirubrobacterales bacterium]|jgi:hypothetical protein|nr:hypothetical protein [Solirubrobacterales bacterium]
MSALNMPSPKGLRWHRKDLQTFGRAYLAHLESEPGDRSQRQGAVIGAIPAAQQHELLLPSPWSA